MTRHSITSSIFPNRIFIFKRRLASVSFATYSKLYSARIYTPICQRGPPLSTTPPTDLATLFDNETKEIKKLLAPGVRRHTEAEANLRSLAIVEKSLNGEKVQPSVGELKHLAMAVASGKKTWNEIFPGVATVTLTTNGYGPSIDLRITKTGMPVQLVKEGTPGATVVAVKRVDELGFYSLGRDDLAKKVGLSGPKTTAVIRFLKLQADNECYKKVTVGKAEFDRYSQKAITAIQDALKKKPMAEIWQSHGIRWKGSK